MQSQALIMCVEVMKLVWQDVGVWDEIKLLSAKALLYLDVVVAKAVFACDLVAHREVVDSLVLIESLIHVALARRCRPADVPLVRFCDGESIGFKD